MTPARVPGRRGHAVDVVTLGGLTVEWALEQAPC